MADSLNYDITGPFIDFDRGRGLLTKGRKLWNITWDSYDINTMNKNQNIAKYKNKKATKNLIFLWNL